jgi:hypothetical protein
MNDMQQLEDMCSAVRPAGPGQLTEARARVMAGISAAPGRAGRSPGRPRQWATWPRLALTAGVAAAATAVAIALVIPSGTSRVPQGDGLELTASVVLGRAANAALSGPVPHAGQFVYTKTRTYFPGEQGQPGLTITQLWQPVVQVWRQPGFSTGPNEGIGVISPCSQDCNLVLDPSRQEPDLTTYAALERLPTAPGALFRDLVAAEARACFTPLPHLTGPTPLAPPSPGRATLEWAGILTILKGVQATPPRLGAALFRAAATIPGVHLVRNATNPAGAPGIGVARTENVRALGPSGAVKRGQVVGTETDVLIFNPHTYQYIGWTQPVHGHVAMAAALLSTRIVNSKPPFKDGVRYTGQEFGMCIS